MANSFRLSEDLIDRFEIPPKTAKWGAQRKAINDEGKNESGYIDSDSSEFVEDDAGRTLRKVKIIDWKKSLLLENWERTKCMEFNAKGDPRAMKSD